MIREWVRLLQLARVRLRSSADYQRFQAYQGNLIIDYLRERGISLRGTRVLDLGCGHGGYSLAFAQAGASIVSVDLTRVPTDLPALTLADAKALPFTAMSFPIIFCASLIEHSADPKALLAEIGRVLAPGGSAYLSYPPFYSPVGGHQFKPFHLLGERWALRLSRHQADSYTSSFGDWGLYPLSIRRTRRLIAEAGLEIRHESTRFSPVNLARIPVLGEFLTWHVQFILCRQAAGDADQCGSQL